jgi:hypothetical protein
LLTDHYICIWQVWTRTLRNLRMNYFVHLLGDITQMVIQLTRHSLDSSGIRLLMKALTLGSKHSLTCKVFNISWTVLFPSELLSMLLINSDVFNIR